MKLPIVVLLSALFPAALPGQTNEFLIPNFPLDRPLHVACLSPQTGNIAIDVLNAAGEPLARFERALKLNTWQIWSILEKASTGIGSLRLRLSSADGVSLSGFFFLGGDKPFQPQDLPKPDFCGQSCFQLVPAAAPKIGRFKFSLAKESSLAVKVFTASKPPRAVVSETIGRRPAGLNSFDWSLVVNPPQGVDHVGLFTQAGSPEFIVVVARVDK
jgi:hypothetical protein